MYCYPSVSVVMALYNPDPVYLKIAVDSIFGQSVPVQELVLVNDGGDISIIESSLPADGRIKIYSKHNGGVADTRNYAITKCSCDFIAFLDQDDYWYKDKIEEQLSLIPDRLDQPCMVVSPVDIVDASGSIRRNKTDMSMSAYRIKSQQKSPIRSLIADNYIYSSTPLVHRSIFKALGGFDPEVQPHDDWEMYLRIAIAGYPIFFAERPLSVWRTHGSNESNRVDLMQRSMCRVYRKLLPAIQDESSRRLFLFRSILTTLNRAGALLYKRGRYRLYRKHVGKALALAVQNLPPINGADPSLLLWEFRDNFRTLIKAIRRYAVSLLRRSK